MTRSRILLSILCVAFGAASARADMVPDQSYDPGTTGGFVTVENSDLGQGVGYFWAQSQTFAVGHSGVLSQVDVKLEGQQIGSPPDVQNENLTLRILTTADDKPANDLSGVLATARIPLSELPSVLFPAPDAARFVSVSLADDPPLTVHAGQKLAIVLSLDSPILGTIDWMAGASPATPPYPLGYSYHVQVPSITLDQSWITSGYWERNDAGQSYGESDAFRTYVTVPEPSLGLLALGALAGLCLCRARRRDAQRS